MKREYPEILNCHVTEGKDGEGRVSLKGEVGVQDQGGHRCFFIPDSYVDHKYTQSTSHEQNPEVN